MFSKHKVNRPFVLRVYYKKSNDVLYTVDEESMKIKEVLSQICLLSGDTIIACMGYDIRGLKFKHQSMKNLIGSATSDYVDITVLRVGDIHANVGASSVLLPQNEFPKIIQHHLYCECGFTTLPQSKDQLDQDLKTYFPNCTHKVSRMALVKVSVV